MNLHAIGEISISISTAIYFVWFVPQIWLNQKRRDTEGLSYWMHGLLLLGYCADLLYGFGLHMQWQYRAVTIFGLLSLLVEHWQIGRYGLHRRSEVINYLIISALCFALLTYATSAILWGHHDHAYYSFMGVISNTCWFLYVLPQIVKNYIAKSTQGLSIGFVIISIALSICDVISAYTLGWDWPSLIGAPVALGKKAILLWQYRYYKNS